MSIYIYVYVYDIHTHLCIFVWGLGVGGLRSLGFRGLGARVENCRGHWAYDLGLRGYGKMVEGLGFTSPLPKLLTTKHRSGTNTTESTVTRNHPMWPSMYQYDMIQQTQTVTLGHISYLRLLNSQEILHHEHTTSVSPKPSTLTL